MKIFIRVFSISLCIVLSSIATFAQGILSGRITGPNGQAIPGASIKVSNSESTKPIGGFSDSRGRYSIKGLTSKSYTVTVSCVGYQKNVKENLSMNNGNATSRSSSKNSKEGNLIILPSSLASINLLYWFSEITIFIMINRFHPQHLPFDEFLLRNIFLRLVCYPIPIPHRLI